MSTYARYAAQLDNCDAAVAEIASRQHGVVTSTQLVEAGLSRSGVDRRVAAGRLHRIHRRVYAVGHPKLSHRGRWMAAVLAGARPRSSPTGPPPSSHLLTPTTGTIDITIPNGSGRRRNGLNIHRSHLPKHEITTLHGIRVTPPPEP